MMFRTALSCTVLTLLAACSPQPPDKEQPPEPQAAHATEKRAPEEQATELGDSIQAPLEKARQVEADVQEAADAQRAAIEAAGG
jgi:hypothetical protein